MAIVIDLVSAWTPFSLLVLSPLFFWLVSIRCRPLRRYRPIAIFAFVCLSIPSTAVVLLTLFHVASTIEAITTELATENNLETSTVLNSNAIPSVAHPFIPTIQSYAARYAVELPLVLAVIEQESLFDPSAVSHAGAGGLMQLMPATATALGVTDRYDIDQNLEAGTRHLSDLIARYKVQNRYTAIPMALAAYNAGEPSVARCRCWNPYAETAAYVPAVLSRYARMTLVSPYAGEYTVVNGHLHGGDPWLRDSKKWPGVDIAGECGEAIHAPISGTVTANGYDGYTGPYGYNNSFMMIENGRMSVMLMHGDYSAELDQVVEAGEVVGVEDTKGNSTGCHTHLAVRVYDVPVNPLIQPGQPMQ